MRLALTVPRSVGNGSISGAGWSGAGARSCSGSAPMACYKDDINLFTLNEVAINWNAPLFWVAVWLDRKD